LSLGEGLDRHRPGGPHPTTEEFMKLLNTALAF
jgi:hypothetical protein